VASLAAGRVLWGNPVDVLTRVRDPQLVSDAFRRHGFLVPAVRAGAIDNPQPFSLSRARHVEAIGGHEGQAHAPPIVAADAEWLVKPLASGGGQGVRPWRGRMPKRCYLQELVPGIPCSVTFVAAGGRAVTLGLSRQLVGDPAFGARGYRYCGSILVGRSEIEEPLGRELMSRAAGLASVAAGEFDLVGVNGVDFIARGSEPVPIEVNPRWCGSMELVERAHGASVFGAHAGACAAGMLPSFDFAYAARSASVAGKAVVFARHAVVIGDTRPWLDDPTVRDVPHAGERIAVGYPVCTVFASGRTMDDCYRGLVARADRAYAELARCARSVA
jgi:predicted ATP-grasp superfamily ATP-dependent carboligase